MMKQIPLLFGQTLIDLAIQEYGHYDGLFTILEDNSDVISDFSEVPSPGTMINIRLNKPKFSDDSLINSTEFARKDLKAVSGSIESVGDKVYVTEGYWEENYSQ